MNRPAAEYLDDILSVAEKWLRRCNGHPADGIPVSRQDLRTVLLASTDVHLDEKDRIAWRAGGPMSIDNRTFTAEPVSIEAPETAS